MSHIFLILLMLFGLSTEQETCSQKLVYGGKQNFKCGIEFVENTGKFRQCCSLAYLLQNQSSICRKALSLPPLERSEVTQAYNWVFCLTLFLTRNVKIWLLSSLTCRKGKDWGYVHFCSYLPYNGCLGLFSDNSVYQKLSPPICIVFQQVYLFSVTMSSFTLS